MTIGVHRCEHWLDYLWMIFQVIAGLGSFGTVKIYERTRCENYLLNRQNQDKLQLQSRQIETTEKEKAVLWDKLNEATKLVKQVMKEGGALLDSYHLDYSDIDFGAEDPEKWCKLGEGAQVLAA